MAYFENIPNLKYPYFQVTNSSSDDTILTKNIFRRAKLRDDFLKYYTYFYKYKIVGDSRPDDVSYEVYGKTDYDWVVLLVNNIINIKREWPMSDGDLNNYLNTKYTQQQLGEIKYYETTEVRDTFGRLILPAGLRVSSSYTLTYNDGEVQRTVTPINQVTNYEYEVLLNDQKRNIYVLKPAILSEFVSEFKDTVRYTDSTDLIDGETKATFNPFITQ